MESYQDYLKRISYQQAELQIGEGCFSPDGRVYEKVNADNSFKLYYQKFTNMNNYVPVFKLT